jgi:hypothetical protein
MAILDRKWMTLGVTAAVTLFGCTAPFTSQQASKVDMSRVRPGMYCRLQVSNPQGQGGGRQEYTGTVTQVTQNEIVLSHASVGPVAETRSPGFFEQLPMANRPSDSMASQADVGTVRLPLAQIAALQPYDPVGSSTESSWNGEKVQSHSSSVSVR